MDFWRKYCWMFLYVLKLDLKDELYSSMVLYPVPHCVGSREFYKTGAWWTAETTVVEAS